MSSFDFSGAPTDQGGMGELIPDRARVWAILTVRPFNLQQGMVLTPGKENPDNRYLDVELTVLDGPYARRKIWHKIGLAGSDKWVAQGMAAVRHILEVGREITNFKQGEPRYRLNEANGERAFMELNELRCAVLVGIEKGQGNYPDKNSVRAFLSPNPASNTNKDFLALVNGDVGGQKSTTHVGGGSSTWGGVTPKTTGAKPAWGAGAPTAPQTTQSAPQTAPTGRPSWAGPMNKPTADDPKNDIPF